MRCLLGDRSQLPNVSKKIFYVVMVGLTTASRALLKWKMSASPDQRERLDAMVETASYEAVLHDLRGKEEDRLSSWELFHSFTRQTRNRMQHLLVAQDGS